MDAKRKRHIREVTHYDSGLVARMRNAEIPENCLSAGSKNRLKQYQNNLSVTRGSHDPNIDKEVLALLETYSLDSAEIKELKNYLFKLVDSDGQEFSRNLKIYSTTQDAMERFAATDHTSFRWNENYRKSLEDLKSEFSQLRLKPLVFTSDDDVRDALPKKDTHSGYYWIQTGRKKKGDNIEGISQVMGKEFVGAVDRGTFGKPILIGFRTQASGEFEDDGTMTQTCKHKLRVVSMVDMRVILGELKFSKPIQDYMGLQPYYAGGKNELQISSVITRWRTKFSRFMSIDYSSFDQTISSWLIEDAFSVVKSAFVMDEFHSSLFDVIVNDFIHKDFILSEGSLHSDKGVPSGSMFTQIIDSIVNLLVVRTFFNHLEAKAEMIAMGDDNLIFTDSEVTMEDLASYLIKNFGLVVKTDDKSNEGRTNKDDPKFLSRYWRFDGQWRHPRQLFSRLIFPERIRSYDRSEVGPEHVIFAFILTYRLGMEKLIDVRRFMHDYPISKQFILENVDSRYLPGALAYIREYT